MSADFFVEGIPAPQGSKRAFTRGGRTVLVESSKKVKPWRLKVSEAAKQQLDAPLDGAVIATVVFAMPRTKAMGTRPAPPMVQRPDLDKLLRSTFDGLTGTGFLDDSQVIEVRASKRRANPGDPTGAHISLTIAEEKPGAMRAA